MNIPSVASIHKRVLLGVVAVVLSLGAVAGIFALAENAQQRVDLATQEEYYALR